MNVGGYIVTRDMGKAEVLNALFIPCFSLVRLFLRPSRSLSLLAISRSEVDPTVEEDRGSPQLNHFSVVDNSIKLDGMQ